MSNTFRTLIQRLEREAIATPPNALDVARTRRPVLAPYPTVEAILDALDDERDATYPLRDAMAHALLREYAETERSLWSSILLVAFYPMLSRLRHRLFSDRIPRDELDQMVVMGFLAAMKRVAAYGYSERVSLRLRQRTWRQVFTALRLEREQALCSADDEELAELEEESTETCPPDPTDGWRVDLPELVVKAAEHGVSTCGMELVQKMALKGLRLREYVIRQEPKDEVARERLYQRLKRRKSRAVRRLRNFWAMPQLAMAA
jgi:hypothetical protein